MDKPRLYLDEDVRLLLAEVLRQRGYDTIHAVEVKRHGKSDSEQLAYAVKNHRVILTHNVRDYILLAKEYSHQGLKHNGIIVSDQVGFEELLKRVLKFLYKNSKEKLENQFIWLHNYK
ncbi:MAG: DUF5615 family PIN-like protein [Candidatus Scalindua sp.]